MRLIAPASSAPRAARASRWVWHVVQGILTVGVTWVIVRQVGLGLDDLRALDPAWWRPRWGLLIVASLAMAGGMLMSAALWGLMVRELGGRPIRPLRATRIFLVANLARYIPGKVWQIAGLAVLARQEGVGPVVATAAAVLGQLIALAAASLLGAGVLVAAGGTLATWGWVAIAAVALGIGLMTIPALSRGVAGLWFRVSRTDEPEGLHPDRTFSLRWVGLYLANWVLYAGAFWILAASFDVNGSFLQIGGAFAAAYVLGYVAVFAPAGIGVRESFLVVFLGPMVGPGPAGALAIISRVWTTLVEGGAALAAMLAGPAHAPVVDGDGPS